MKLHQRLGTLIEFLDRHVFGHVKCFDDQTDDRSAGNFYLEREWRLVTGITFNQEDLAFVIVPRNYEEQFRRDFAAIPRGKIRLAEDCRHKGKT